MTISRRISIQGNEIRGELRKEKTVSEPDVGDQYQWSRSSITYFPSEEIDLTPMIKS